jgi:DNA-binding GntR family transcriptional regulator
MLTLKQHAYKIIRDKLNSGEMSAGSRLSDDALSKEIGISRSPIREAISQLASEGLVEYRPRCGAFVKSLSRRDMEELYEVRGALEGFAAARAATLASEEQIAELERCHRDVLAIAQKDRKATKQGASLDRNAVGRFLSADMQFHLHILQAAGNKRLLEMVEDCKILIRVFGHSLIKLDKQLIEQSAEQHARIIDALRRRDADAARDLVMSHIAMASQRLSETLPPQS